MNSSQKKPKFFVELPDDTFAVSSDEMCYEVISKKAKYLKGVEDRVLAVAAKFTAVRGMTIEELVYNENDDVFVKDFYHELQKFIKLPKTSSTTLNAVSLLGDFEPRLMKLLAESSPTLSVTDWPPLMPPASAATWSVLTPAATTSAASAPSKPKQGPAISAASSSTALTASAYFEEDEIANCAATFIARFGRAGSMRQLQHQDPQ